MKYLYYCNSAYQIINSLKLQLKRRSEGNQGDILIQRSFSGAEIVADRLKENRLFDGVYLFDKDRKTKTPSEKIMAAFTPGKFLEYRFQLGFLAGKYDVLSIPKVNKFLGFVWRANSKAKLEYFEEGAGSYFEKFNVNFEENYLNILNRIFNCGKTFEDYNTIYLNSPGLLYGRDINALKLPNSDDLDCRPFKNFKELLVNIFTMKDITPFKKINWISQKTSFDNYMTNDETFLDELGQYKDILLYRPHPRFNSEGGNAFTKDDINENFEIKAILDKDIDNKIFISHFSTACIVPKLLFNEEPYLIFLYRTWEEDRSDLEEFVARFINTYSIREKIAIVSSKEEFLKTVNKFLNKKEA